MLFVVSASININGEIMKPTWIIGIIAITIIVSGVGFVYLSDEDYFDDFIDTNFHIG